MTRGQLVNMLERVAATHHTEILESLKRNMHLHDLTETDLRWLEAEQDAFQRIADAVLVDFINQVATEQGLDLGLKTKHLTHGAAHS